MALLHGKPASMEAAIAHAAGILKAARRPLVCGLGGISTEAQRVAVGIADSLGGVADWTVGQEDTASPIALQTVGAVAASYGELADRADTLVYWRCPPDLLPGFDRIQPRHQRRIVTIGEQSSGSEKSLMHLPLKPGGDYEALATLRAILSDVEPDAEQVLSITGLSLENWKQLAQVLKESHYVAFIRGSQLASEGHSAVAALTQLAQALHNHSRAAIVSPANPNNNHGAENALAWQTGYPMAVSFAGGFPEYGPDEFTTEKLLCRNEVDTALIVDTDQLASLSDAALDNLNNMPRVALNSRAGSRLPALQESADIIFQVAPLNQSGGTYYRSDGLALRNEPADTKVNTATAILTQLAAAVQ